MISYSSLSQLPNVFAEGRDPKDWWKATNLAYNAVLFGFYLPIAVVAYYVYGSYLTSVPPFLFQPWSHGLLDLFIL